LSGNSLEGKMGKRSVGGIVGAVLAALMCWYPAEVVHAASKATIVQGLMAMGAMPLIKCMEYKGQPELEPCITAARAEKFENPDEDFQSKDASKIYSAASQSLGFYMVDLFIAESNFHCRKSINAKEALHPICSKLIIGGELDAIDVMMSIVNMKESEIVSILGIKEPILTEMKMAYGKK
jgi:hypothetical protein